MTELQGIIRGVTQTMHDIQQHLRRMEADILDLKRHRPRLTKVEGHVRHLHNTTLGSISERRQVAAEGEHCDVVKMSSSRAVQTAQEALAASILTQIPRREGRDMLSAPEKSAPTRRKRMRGDLLGDVPGNTTENETDGGNAKKRALDRAERSVFVHGIDES